MSSFNYRKTDELALPKSDLPLYHLSVRINLDPVIEAEKIFPFYPHLMERKTIQQVGLFFENPFMVGQYTGEIVSPLSQLLNPTKLITHYRERCCNIFGRIP